MPASILGRIARYGVSGLRDSREDRLTEIFAALCDSTHCEDFARHMALGWLQRAAASAERPAAEELSGAHSVLAQDNLSWSCDVATQVWFVTPDGPRRPDLELRFSGTNADIGVVEELLLWVEIKHGTSPHTGQLQAYLTRQSEVWSRSRAVLLVAPREDIARWPYQVTSQEIPAEVPILTWQETAELARTYTPSGPVGEFLINEFCAYLQEEELMDPSQLTPVHLVALVNYHEAKIALDHLCGIAATEVNQRWNRGFEPGSYSSERWWTYPPQPRDATVSAPIPSDWHFQWQLFHDSAYIFKDGSPGVPLFAVGTVSDKAQHRLASLDNSTRTKLEQASFALFPTGATKSSNNEYIWRTGRPEDILAGRDLLAQGHSLATWICDAFRALTDAFAVAN